MLDQVDRKLSMIAGRYFIGLWPDDDVVKALAALGQKVSHWGCLNQSSQMHITLQYLGELTEKQVSEIDQSLQHIEAPLIREVIDTWGEFKGPRIVWVGPKHPSQALQVLHHKIRLSTEQITNLKAEAKYVPHFTLVRDIQSDTLGRYKELPVFSPIEIFFRKFYLARSEQRQYHKVRSYSL